MQIARETDLPELLSHLGYQVKRVGRFHTTAEMDSLRIKDRCTWFRYSQNTGGDAITFLQQYCGKSFSEAVEYLLTFHGKARDTPAPQPKPISRKQEFSLPPRNADDRRVFAYLRKRDIAAQVIRQFLNAGLLYEDAVHHNCVFVGKNSAGQAKYAELRGTYDLDGPGFKGDAPGSDKNTGFSLPHDPRSDLVLVFEAPIDLMSYLTLHRDMVNAVALCGLYDGALQTYLQAHPEIRRIALCLDADEPGEKAAQQNSYHDPAEHWMQASGRTNELDTNSVVTRETFKCGECGKATSFEVFRVPEYTRNGQPALSRNVKYSDGTMVDGVGKGDTMDGIPGKDATYTGYHYGAASG